MSPFEWTYDEEYRAWSINADGAYIEIAPRPGYCDRGRYLVTVSGLGDIDFQDAFPRYFMDLERAKKEMAEWLGWRLRMRVGASSAFDRWNARNSIVIEFGMAVQGLQNLGIANEAQVAQLKALWLAFGKSVDGERGKR